MEHCCRGSEKEQALELEKQGQSDQPTPPQRGKGSSRGHRKSKANSLLKGDNDSLTQLEKLKKLFYKSKTNSRNSNVNVVAESSKDSLEDPQKSDSDTYVIGDEVLALGFGVPDTIYLDSGAGHSFVNQLRYLTNFIQVRKQVNTYAEPVKITHKGTLVFHGIHVLPVYFAPKGKVNLL
ncbi:hypothetical protein O181_082832 [Austropuccinia psidii MF-1]|uniref:Uncharacterized protein n=1 Tax=Austropuccinia psidii MF-1 TaxID=1389203 RepID=A0A9Q3IJK8_9BASI|nr:hypothetical protein [Austropuccinia psidii MF-1]